jgi:hypothetical protein
MAEKMVYLARKNGAVVHHTDKTAMAQTDGVEPEKQVTVAEFEAAGGLARIINNKIFLGKTADEKAEDERQAQIQDWKDELADIDKEAGAGRAVRGAALAAAKKAGVSNEDTAHLQDFEDRADTLRQKITQKMK